MPIFLAVLLVAMIGGGVAIATWGGQDEKAVVIREAAGVTAPTTPPTGDAAKGGPVGGVEHTEALLRGVKQEGITIGTGPITVLEFVDFQCPYCKQHQLQEQPAAVQELVRTGRARLAMLPLAFLGPDSEKARTVFLKLSERNLGWNFADLLFRNQGTENTGYMTPEYLKALVAKIPGTTPADADPTPNAYSEHWAGLADAVGKTGAIKGTPSFAVGITGQEVGDFQAAGSDWAAAVRAVQLLEQQGTSPSTPTAPPSQGGPGTPGATPAPSTPLSPELPRDEQPSGRITT